MTRRIKVTTRHIAQRVIGAADRLYDGEVVALAHTSPVLGLFHARRLIDTFERGAREALYVGLEAAYVAAERLASMPQERARLAKWFGEKASNPKPLDTLRLALRFVYRAKKTGTSRYSQCCRYAHVIEQARDCRVPPGGLRAYILGNGGIDGISNARSQARRSQATPSSLASRQSSKKPPEPAPTDRPAVEPPNASDHHEPGPRPINIDLATDLVVQVPKGLERLLAMGRGANVVLYITLAEIDGDWRVFRATNFRTTPK